MTQHDERDRRMAELFSAAREEDEAAAPVFRELIARRRRTSTRRRPRWFTIRPAFALATSGFAVAALAMWIGAHQLVVDDAPVARSGLRLADPSQSVTTVRKYVPPSPAPQSTATESDGDKLQARSPTSGPETRENESAPAPFLVPSPEPPPPPMNRLARKARPEEWEPKKSTDETAQTVPRVADMAPRDPSAVQLEDFERVKRIKGETSTTVAVSSPAPKSSSGASAESVLASLAYTGGGQPAQYTEEGYARRARASGFVVAEVELPPETPGFNTESYAPIRENDFQSALDHPLSTFSIDVDTASYTNVRRFLDDGKLPPADAVRIEELLNYFKYDYPLPDGDAPFSASVEVAGCPWNPEHRLARIGLKGREVSRHDYRGSNLVFLIDVSGSMQPPNKLPLLKSALALLADQLDGRDQVAIVVYAGSSGLVLPSTSGAAKSEILDALDHLQAGGSTNGGAGLRLAYRVARENFIEGGVNRVILATDGDFNVGVTSKGDLLKTIETDAREGIFLTALGFGMDNYKDDTLELLADRGNGNYAYIDSLKEARRVLVEEIGGTLITIAKDVKIQVEFNPLEVGAYRLIGYENRKLNKEDFNDDRKDAGEIGSGHTVTALYEIVPPDLARSTPPAVDPLKYRQPGTASREAESGELFTLKLRYKEPEENESRLLSFPVTDGGASIDQASPDFRFAAAVAMFGMVLRDSEHKGRSTLGEAARLALAGMQRDVKGLRAEFHDLIDRARQLEK